VPKNKVDEPKKAEIQQKVDTKIKEDPKQAEILANKRIFEKIKIEEAKEKQESKK